MDLEEYNFFKKRMEAPTCRWLLNIFLAILIYYLAEISRMLGLHIPPLGVSAIWPASGLSLAALLLFGYRITPGIIAGNLLNNCLQLLGNGASFLSLATGISVAFGSTLETLIAAYIIKRFASSCYFASLKDILIFLIPASLISCAVAAVIGGVSIGLYENYSLHLIWKAGLFIFIGDLMGVYVFTPLLIIWLASTPLVSFRKYWRESVGMIATLLALFFLCGIKSYPLTQFYIPLSMWASYRFRLHGATLAILAISIAIIIPTSLGVGTFATIINDFENRILLLVTYLEIITSLSLVIAALVNEREAIIHFLEMQNIDMRQSMEVHVEAIKKMAKDVFIKEKLESLDRLTSKIAYYLNTPLNKIFTQASNIKGSLESFNADAKFKDSSKIEDLYKQMETSLDLILKNERDAHFIATILQEQTTLSNPQKTKAKILHINVLLNTCLNRVIQDVESKFPNFAYRIERNFDKTITTSIILPEDLAHVFTYFFNIAFDSLQQKKEMEGENFNPQIYVQTVNQIDDIEIIIRDNGAGINDSQLRNLFQSFIEIDEESEIRNMALALAHDIIVSVYHGSIRVESHEGSYTKFIIILPKEI